MWQALRAAADAEDEETTKAIIQGAGIIVTGATLEESYDELGFKYEVSWCVFTLT